MCQLTRSDTLTERAHAVLWFETSGASTSDSWRQVKFTFLGHGGAVDVRLKQAMIESEVLARAAIANAALPP